MFSEKNARDLDKFNRSYQFQKIHNNLAKPELKIRGSGASLPNT